MNVYWEQQSAKSDRLLIATRYAFGTVDTPPGINPNFIFRAKTAQLQ
ncbi:hypothetical protein QUB80_03775 [Chlorogloeopsis sp. ULAP01]|nr:hypothetical protein [Chlorogloeopsis sp. ULAP01]